MILCSACRFNEKGSKFGLDGSLVQHGGECDSKGVPAMLERLYELPEGKKYNFMVHHEWEFLLTEAPWLTKSYSSPEGLE
jgi:hypothetical protein